MIFDVILQTKCGCEKMEPLGKWVHSFNDIPRLHHLPISSSFEDRMLTRDVLLCMPEYRTFELVTVTQDYVLIYKEI